MNTYRRNLISITAVASLAVIGYVMTNSHPAVAQNPHPGSAPVNIVDSIPLPISGTVAVSNFPSPLQVTGTVQVANQQEPVRLRGACTSNGVCGLVGYNVPAGK